MIKISRRYKGVIVTLLFILQYSCVPQACLDETISSVKANFYQTGTGKAFAPDSVTVSGKDIAEKLYDRTIKTMGLKLPLNPASDTCIYIIKINNQHDTLTFVYNSFPHLVSKECGFTYFHSLDTAYNTSDAVDIIIKNRTISTLNEENIRIFF